MTSPAIVESLDQDLQAAKGSTVLSATDGDTGLDLLRRHRVGVLLTDLMMPQHQRHGSAARREDRSRPRPRSC
jgi:CheY-like chemotaxis protein